MKYEGPNREQFERDARFFNDWKDGKAPSEINAEAHKIADRYRIEYVDVWDYLPEYERRGS